MSSFRFVVRLVYRYLVEFPYNLLKGKNRRGFHLVNLLEAFPNFDPNSGPGYRTQTKFLREAAANLPNSLSLLIDSVELAGNGPPSRSPAVISLSSFPDAPREFEKFNAENSDKAKDLTYYRFYAQLLRHLSGAENGIFEIGLGSNDEGVPSNMTRRGTPGASLRAFRDLSDGPIYGADIDPNSLIQEERITTFQLDQLDANAIRRIIGASPQNFSEKGIANLKGTIDVFIDDGLHSVTANINSVALGLYLIKPARGVVVVEDLRESGLQHWMHVGKLLAGRSYRSWLLRCDNSNAYMFIASNNPDFHGLLESFES